MTQSLEDFYTKEMPSYSYSYVKIIFLKNNVPIKLRASACYAGMGSWFREENFDSLCLCIKKYSGKTFNVNYTSLVEDMKNLFSKIVKFESHDTKNIFFLTMSFNGDYPVPIKISITSAIFSVLRYIDNEYNCNYDGISDNSSFIKSIQTFKDVFHNGELLKAGNVGHNAHDYITITFSRFGDTLIDSYIHSLAGLDDTMLTSNKCSAILKTIYAKNTYQDVSSTTNYYYFFGQSFHFNVLAYIQRRLSHA